MLSIKSLHAKLILSFLALMIIPLIATNFYGHFFTLTALSKQALERSSYQVHLQAESIVSALHQVHGDAIYLGELRSLNIMRQQTAADVSEFWRREVEQDFLVLASVRPMYHSLRLMNDEGQEIVHVHQTDDQRVIATSTAALQDHHNRTYFNEVIRRSPNSVYVAPFLLGNVPYIHYSIRLPDGVLDIDLNANWLLRALPISPGSDTWAMFDQDGRFIVYPAGFDPQANTDLIPTMMANGNGSLETPSSVIVYDTIYPSGRSNNAALPDQFWVIFRQTPAHILYESVDDFYRIAFLFTAGAVLLTILLAMTTSQLFVRPIKQLEGLAAQFGHTGAVPELPPQLPNDEIGSLTRTFFDMAYELDGKRKQERRLIERLIRAQEEERKLVAYDLHDGLIQQLVGARFHFSNCHTLFEDQPPERLNSIQQGCSVLTEAIIEGRRIIEGLRPAALDDLGLAAAIEEIARSTASTANWSLRLDLQPLPVEPEKTVGVTLYRIAQEALNNARKHANARHVHVSLHNGNGIFLTIEDDGVGFDMARLAHEGEARGLGITTMQERASLINGHCFIYSQPGSGTRVEVHVPGVLVGQITERA